ncbi:hypothetical protein [Archangium lansingense]|uniref:Lipoprotein n=1 Tax=Archangium lansingense TaxID=2995310 RepID=A0ABT4ALL0_9BACT|nr:hypothetical protein [Archangium lansinium]MCY1081729.1 hypothetical protein [Archangium lansinium]
MSRRTLRRTFTCLLFVVPTLVLSGCFDYCENLSDTFEDTFDVADILGEANTPSPAGTTCEELCKRAAGYEQVPCRMNNVGTKQESVTCIVNYQCEE